MFEQKLSEANGVLFNITAKKHLNLVYLYLKAALTQKIRKDNEVLIHPMFFAFWNKVLLQTRIELSIIFYWLEDPQKQAINFYCKTEKTQCST